MPPFAASATCLRSAAPVRSYPQYCATAPFTGTAPVSWCQPITVLPYFPTTAWAFAMNAT